MCCFSRGLVSSTQIGWLRIIHNSSSRGPNTWPWVLGSPAFLCTHIHNLKLYIFLILIFFKAATAFPEQALFLKHLFVLPVLIALWFHWYSWNLGSGHFLEPHLELCCSPEKQTRALVSVCSIQAPSPALDAGYISKTGKPEYIKIPNWNGRVQHG